MFAWDRISFKKLSWDAIWMELEGVMLRERSQKEDKPRLASLLSGIAGSRAKVQTISTDRKSENCSN